MKAMQDMLERDRDQFLNDVEDLNEAKEQQKEFDEEFLEMGIESEDEDLLAELEGIGAEVDAEMGYNANSNAGMNVNTQ